MSARVLATIKRNPDLIYAFPGKDNPFNVMEELEFNTQLGKTGLNISEFCLIVKSKREATWGKIWDKEESKPKPAVAKKLQCSAENVRNITRSAFDSLKRNDVKCALNKLMKLSHISTSIGSAILSWCNGGSVPVIDRHAVRSWKYFTGRNIFYEVPDSFSVQKYIEYKAWIDNIYQSDSVFFSNFGNGKVCSIDFFLYAFSRIYLGPLNKRQVPIRIAQ